MISFLYSIDKAVFLFLNTGFANPFFDWIMPVITESDNWHIPIGIIWLSLLIFGGKKGRITALLVIIILTLSDQFASSVLKPLFGRTRPCFVVEGARLLIRQSHSESFPSSHAANMASMATLFSFQYRKWIPLFLGIAVIVSFSRIYVGVHYPSDILGGWMAGFICAGMVLIIKKEIVRRLSEKKKSISKPKEGNIVENMD